MNLQNGYKVIYEKITDGERTFFASKLDGEDAKQIGNAIKIGKYKLVYEKDGMIYGSETGTPAEGDDCFDAFNEVFKVAAEAAAIDVEDEEPAQTEPDEPVAPVEDEEPAEDEEDEIEE